MGLFFNYDKPGPGVDKNAPKHWGIFLYFELLWRNFGKMLLSNMLYFVVSMPVLALYFISTYLLGFLTPAGIILVAFLCWISFMRFIVDFYSARVIKKRILPKFEEPEEGEE